MRLLRRVATALLILVGMVMVTAASLAVTEDWLVALGVRVGIAERGQSSLDISIYVNQVSAEV